MRFLLLLLSFLSSFAFAQETSFSVNKIWDEAPHNAFTDLTRFKGKFYCAFREGSGHIPGTDGRIRILTSRNGKKWKSLTLLSNPNYDLRDPKISVMPDGRLMVLMGGSDYEEKKLLGMLPHVSFSDSEGRIFSEPEPIRIQSDIRTNWDWLWRVSWSGDVGYGVVYVAREERSLYLVETKNGIDYQKLKVLEVEGSPNETGIQLMPDGEMLIFLRREGGNKHGLLGRSLPPYQDWRWNDLGFRLGGPDMLQVPFEEETLVFGTRVYEETGAKTALFIGNREGKLQEKIRLPSGGDTSYPGMVVYKKHLYVSYYSSHEGKTSIYLAKVPLRLLKE